jgi:uncharacterized protein (TIGR00269 family)
MKCSKCDNSAIIKIPYANIYLCKDHFIQWFEIRFEKTIKEYKMVKVGDKVAVAVSGGKDSTTLLHLMVNLAKKMDFEVIGINIDLGIDEGTNYSRKSTEFAKRNFEILGIKYRIVNLKEEYGFTISDTKGKLSRPVCSTCGIVKRYLINKIAIQEGANVVATGHNLNDMAQFILSGYINGDIISLYKLKPILPEEKGFIKKIKPLFLTPEKEILTYALVKGIPFIYDSCPFTFRIGGPMQDTLRRSLEGIEEKIPGSMMRLVKNFEEKIRPMIENYVLKEEELSTCKSCGMPTAKGRELCSFCAIRNKIIKKSIKAN